MAYGEDEDFGFVANQPPEEDDDLGFVASVKPIPEKSIPERAWETIKRFPGDLYEVGKDIAALPFISRGDFISGLSTLRQGAEKVFERGLAPSDAPPTPAELAYSSAAKPLVNALKNPSTIPEQLLSYAEEHPAKAMMDISTGLGAMGKISEAAKLTKAASVLNKASEYTNPINAVVKPMVAIPRTIGKTEVPEWLYEKALKMPPGSVRHEVRGKVINNLLNQEGEVLTGGTFERMKGKIGKLDDVVKQAAEEASVQYNATASIDNVVRKLEGMKGQYKNRSNPKEYYDAIDEVKDRIVEHDFAERLKSSQLVYPNSTLPYTRPISTPTGKMMQDNALSLKKGLYQEAQNWFLKKDKPITGRTGINEDAFAKAKVEAASVLRDEFMSDPRIPAAAKEALQSEAGLQNALKWVERATNRGGNTEVLSLGGLAFGILVGNHVPATIAYNVARSQTGMTAIAVALRKMGIPNVANSTNIMFQAGQMEDMIPEQPPF